MRRVVTSTAEGATLDWLVCRAQNPESFMTATHVWRQTPDGEDDFLIPKASIDDSVSGPIIDEYFIHTGPATYGPASVIHGLWNAVIGLDPDNGQHLYACSGPTRQVAAMRCFVMSELGETTEVPDELT